MRIAVIDGQGGGIGKYVIQRVREQYPDVEIIALGTNAVAAANMLRAGANDAASGENAIRCTCGSADVIIGTISIVLANSMLGELTEGMAAAIADSAGLKLLLPLTRVPVEIMGARSEPLPHLVDEILDRLADMGGDENV